MQGTDFSAPPSNSETHPLVHNRLTHTMHIALRLSKRVDQSDAIVIKRNLSKRRSILQSLTIGTTNKSSTCMGSLALGSNSSPIEKRSKWHDSNNVSHIVWAQQKSERTCTCDQPGKDFEQKHELYHAFKASCKEGSPRE